MKKNERVTWLDTYCEGGHSYDEYKEWCEDNELGADIEGSEDYWRWINEEIWNDVECFFENLKYSKGVVQQPCVISGVLGLWWGKARINNEMESDLGDAVRRCMGCGDASEVYSENGVVYVISMHHDGENRFEIRPLTERGAERMEEGEDICVGNHWHTGKYPKYLF